MSPLRSTLFLPGRKWTVELTVDQEIGEDPRGRPRYPIGPTLDAGRLLLVDEDVPTHNQLIALAVMRAT